MAPTYGEKPPPRTYEEFIKAYRKSVDRQEQDWLKQHADEMLGTLVFEHGLRVDAEQKRPRALMYGTSVVNAANGVVDVELAGTVEQAKRYIDEQNTKLKQLDPKGRLKIRYIAVEIVPLKEDSSD